MRSNPLHQRRTSSLAIASAILAMAVALAFVVLQTRQRRAHERDDALAAGITKADEELATLLRGSRATAQLLASNPAFPVLTTAVDGHAPDTELALANAVLAQLQQLYPGLVSEACLIAPDGRELARITGGRIAPLDQLTPDESINPFYAPTMALASGEVYQSPPMRSHDTDEMVIANSAPIDLADGARAVVHYELLLSGLLLHAGHGRTTLLLNGDGRILAEGFGTQATGGAARFVGALPHGIDSGITTVGHERLAFQRVDLTPSTRDRWYLAVTTDRRIDLGGPVGWLLLVALGAAAPFVVLSLRTRKLLARSEAIVARFRSAVTVSYEPGYHLATGQLASLSVCPEFRRPPADPAGAMLLILAAVADDLARWAAVAPQIAVIIAVPESVVADRAFAAAARRTLELAGAKGDNLLMAVPGAAARRAADRASAAFADLSRFDVTLLLDGCLGTAGFPSIRHLPIAGFALPREQSRDLDKRPIDREILAAALDVAHRRGLRALALGVDYVATVTALRSLGCDIAAGPLFGVPVNQFGADRLIAQQQSRQSPDDNRRRSSTNTVVPTTASSSTANESTTDAFPW